MAQDITVKLSPERLRLLVQILDAYIEEQVSNLEERELRDYVKRIQSSVERRGGASGPTYASGV